MGRPIANDLARRDPALAALLGALPGADYGRDPRAASFGEWGPGPGYLPNAFNPGYPGFGFGVDAPPPPPPPPPPMHPAAMAAHHGGHNPYAAYAALMGHPAFWGGRYGYYGHTLPGGPPPAESAALWTHEQAETARRARLLDPNEHSRLKIERYSFSINNQADPFTIGTVNAAAAFDLTLQPNTRIRAQRVVCNAPAVNFVILTTLQIANINVFVGQSEDAFTYSALGQGVMLDLPTLDPANRATVSGNYTGLVPSGFSAEFAFVFIVTFQGPSTLVGGL